MTYSKCSAIFCYINRKKILLLTVLAMLFFCPFIAQAQSTYYVRGGATGSNTGSDWANAFTALPAMLVRGATYYLASGSYGGYTFDDAASGATVITIKKATASDHGTDTGWKSVYGEGQAVFSNWAVYTDYWVFDGQVRNSDWKTGGTNAYGIKVSGVGPLRLDNGGGVGADNVKFRYIDFRAGGQNTGRGDDVVYGLSGNQNITFQYCALHDSDRTIWLMRGCWQNLLVEYCYIARNTSTPAVHGEMLSDTCSDYAVFRYNVIENIQGTGVWAILNGRGGKNPSNTANGWKIYGNVIHWTQGYGAGVSAVFYSANDASNSNWTDNLSFINNTINDYDFGQQYFGFFIQAGSGNSVVNNIWYDPKGSAQVGVSADYNWYYGTSYSGDSGANTQNCTTGCSAIFANRSGKDFTLSGASLPNPGDRSKGTEFASDMNGVKRGEDGVWDRGAFEYGGNQISTPSAPLQLRIMN